MNFFISFILAALFTVALQAQVKETGYYGQTWLGYMNQIRISDKWGISGDLHLRTKEEMLSRLSQSILRFGLNYYLNEITKLTAGYAYVTQYPGDNHTSVSQPEHRPWQQIQWNIRTPKHRLMHSVRLEERFRRKILNNETLAPGYSFNWKLRFGFAGIFPLCKRPFAPRSLSFFVNDELHINFGKQIVNNYFDQNRFFTGFIYQINDHDNLQFGWMYLFQQLAAGNRYKAINAARILYSQNLDLRKKK